jgi:pimeloyl-ACP methyl ester carboxylesterase
MLANPQNMAHHSRYALPPDQPTRSRLSRIEVPTLIVVGEADIPDVHTHIGVIQAGIAGSELVVLEHSGHLCHREVPGEFNRLVLEFLEADQPGTR